MSEKKRGGLGRGLESLFFENSQFGTEEKINMLEIIPNPNQPRKSFKQDGISALAESIRQHGLIQPIILKRRDDGKYLIVAGERRWRAAQLAGVSEISAVVRDLSDDQVMQLSLLENLQREDLNPIDEANSYRMLLNILKLDQTGLATVLSIPRSTISNSLRLLNLPAEIRSMLEAGRLTSGHAKCLLAGGLTEKKIQKIADIIVKKDLSVRETEALIKKALEQKTTKVTSRNVSDCELIKRDLSEILGKSVKALCVGGKYKISFSCRSYEEIQNIISRLKP